MKTQEQIPRRVYRVVRKKDDVFIAEASVISKNRSWYTFQQGDRPPFRENGMHWYDTIPDAAYSFFVSQIRLHKILSGNSDVSEQTKDDVWAIVGELFEWGILAGKVEAMREDIKRQKSMQWRQPLSELLNHEADQRRFLEHLEYASRIVRTWPTWKQNILGVINDRATNPVQRPDGAGDTRRPEDSDAADRQGSTDREDGVCAGRP